VLLELEVPASMIVWLEDFGDWFGPGVEKVAVTLLTLKLMNIQESMHKGAYGGRARMSRIVAAVDVWLAEPANCGPTAARARAFMAVLEEIHGF
jgi:hypothetical protein